MSHQLNWEINTLHDLSITDYHHLLALRASIFIVEQNCPYQDIDDKDLSAFHVYGKIDQNIVAVCRILPPGISYAEISHFKFSAHFKISFLFPIKIGLIRPSFTAS